MPMLFQWPSPLCQYSCAKSVSVFLLFAFLVDSILVLLLAVRRVVCALASRRLSPARIIGSTGAKLFSGFVVAVSVTGLLLWRLADHNFRAPKNMWGLCFQVWGLRGICFQDTHTFPCNYRDIKAGNILLNAEGHAKLADFGVAGQLTVSAIICEHRPYLYR